MRSIFAIFLVITYCILLGAVYFMYRSNQSILQFAMTSKPAAQPMKKAVKLPADAVKISECVPDMGQHWVRPQDIPGGPYYVVYQNNVVAVEYMFKPEDIPGQKAASFTQQEFEKYMKDNNYTLADVVRNNEAVFPLDPADYYSMHIAWSAPHAGYPVPHIDVHAYLIPEPQVKAICPDVSIEQVYSPEVIKTIQERNIPFPEAPKNAKPQDIIPPPQAPNQ